MLNGMKTFGAFIALSVLSIQAATLSGRVTAGGSGSPVSGAKVVIISQQGSVDSTSTNAQGQYSLDDVATGPHTVVASREGYQIATTNVTVVSGANTVNITLTASPSVRSGSIAGTVRQAANNQALSGAMVVASVRTGGRTVPVDSARTDASGRYILGSLPVDEYTVSVSAPDYVSESETGVAVANNDTTTVNFSLDRVPPPTGSISGKVTDMDSDSALAGVLVILRRRDGTDAWVARESTLTAADGSYRFAQLASSTTSQPYSVAARKAEYNAYASGSLTVNQTAPTVHNISLDKISRGTLRIFVGQDTTGRPGIAGATLLVAPQADPLAFVGSTTDAQGWASYPGLVEGRYIVSTRADGFLAEGAVATVDGSGTDTVSLLLARATSANSKVLSGLIRDGAAKPLHLAKIVLRVAASNITLLANSNASGDFDFRGIPSSVTSATVIVEMTGFTTTTQTVALSSSANFLNVTLNKTVSIGVQGGVAASFRVLNRDGLLTLDLPVSPWAGRLSGYDARGALAYSVAVPAGGSRMSLPSKASVRFLVLERGGMVEKLQVAPAR